MATTVGDSKTECSNPKTDRKSEVSNKGGSVKKRKDMKEVVVGSSDHHLKSKRIKNTIDNDANCTSRSLELDQTPKSGSSFDAFALNGSGDGNVVIIPKRPRGFVGRSRFPKSSLDKPVNPNYTSLGKMVTLSGISDGNPRNNAKNKGIHMVSSNKHISSERRVSNSRKRKISELNSKTVAKKVESSSKKAGALDDLEQNAARMLSSRFNPTGTSSAAKSTTFTNVFSEKPISASDPASAEAADSESRLKKRLEGEGTSKRRQYYEVHTFRMGAHWYLNRKIKIYWPLDKCWYYGRITDYDLRSNLHHVVHDDGDNEWVCLDEERFEILLRPYELPRKPIIKDTTCSEDTLKKPASVNVQDDSFMDNRMESEPLISWLTHRVNSSTSTLEKQSRSSVLLDTSIYDKWRSEGKTSSDVEDDLPIVYLMRRIRNHRFRDTSAGVLKLVTTALTECKKFEVCAAFWPMLINVALGADILWLIRCVFLLQYGTMVTMWPNVILEVLFVDNIIGLRLFRFKGCLKQAVAFVLLIMKVFGEFEEDESANQQIPVTSIRFNISFVQSSRKYKVFSCCRFSKIRDFIWKYLDSKFQPYCVLSKQLSLSECTHENVKLLEAGTQCSVIPYAAQTAPHEVLHKKSDHDSVLVPISSGSSKHLPKSRTINNLKHGNISLNFLFSLHLKSLLERGIILINDDDCSHQPVSAVVCASSHHGQPAAIVGVRKRLTTSFISSEASGISDFNNRPSGHLGVIKEPPTSNLKGVSVDGIICQKSSSYRDLWADGPKKPRTQVQYTLPKNKVNSQTSQPYHRLRKSSDKMTSSELAAAVCEANILIYGGNKGWRERGAHVSIEPDEQNEWKLAVKRSGELRYTYKVVQDLQPGSTNRYTHAMIWKGGKDWGLEFSDRSQWSTFKEMHEECHNRNIRAASLKKIPLPGVRVINDSVDDDMPCFNRGFWYMRQVGDDVEMALDVSHVMYDMDSEDEEWVSKEDLISDVVFEKVMDMFEKVSYSQKRDHFTPEEIDELVTRVSPVQVAKSVYDYWWEKRQRKRIPLIRQLQPPSWEIYQQRCREWEKQNLKLTTGPLSGSREKGSTAEDKPPMFAFCLKPRGLEFPNKGFKHRPQKKISLSSQYNTSAGDHPIHRSSGKKPKGKKSGAPYKLVVGGPDLVELKARDALTTLKHARDNAKLKRERARKLMMSADVAMQKAVSALMIAEAMKGSCKATGNDDPSTTS